MITHKPSEKKYLLYNSNLDIRSQMRALLEMTIHKKTSIFNFSATK